MEDNAFEFECIRATLDAFWSHSSRTVEGYLSQVKFMLKYANMLNLSRVFPRLGPFPLGHHLGMNIGDSARNALFGARNGKEWKSEVWDGQEGAGHAHQDLGSITGIR